ncbi:hypothetical protein NLJ89_g12195 [Agrocybe chaxingu]|uniref:Uncharacterized protein n=1 Tax=Agrocybe chaxingu TaxID=84603 RepID=A0A9W8JUW5_9AGAR|nr:hypothetical protein NLJ89_g12195 [Agrocybe chaxingu]
MNVTIGSTGRYNKGKKAALRAGIIGRPFPLPPPPTKYVLVPTKPKTSSSSRNVGRLLTSAGASSSAGQLERLTQRNIQELHRKENEEARHRLSQMTTEEMAALQAFRTSLNTDDTDDNDTPAPEHTINLDDILTGDAMADVSHAGGEFAQLLAIEDDIFSARKRKDPRTRHDRAQRCVDAFAVQLPALLDAYMHWQFVLGDQGYEADYTTPDMSTAQRTYEIAVVDVFSSTRKTITELASDTYVALLCLAARTLSNNT